MADDIEQSAEPVERYEQVADNIWRDNETGVTYIGRDGQSLESMLQEAADAATIPVPENFQPLNPYQFRAMIAIAGIEQAIDDAVAAIPDVMQKAVARAKLDYALAFHRDDPLISMLAPTVGLTDDQIDTMWRQAVQL